MPAATYDILIEQGATFRFSLIYGRKTSTLDSDGNEIIVPYDLVGAIARMQIRQRRGSEVLTSATTLNGGITIDTVTGKLTITISEIATDLLTVARAKYDLEIQYPSGDVVRVMQGNVKVSANITQNADFDDILSSVPAPYDVDEQAVPGPD